MDKIGTRRKPKKPDGAVIRHGMVSYTDQRGSSRWKRRQKWSPCVHSVDGWKLLMLHLAAASRRLMLGSRWRKGARCQLLPFRVRRSRDRLVDVTWTRQHGPTHQHAVPCLRLHHRTTWTRNQPHLRHLVPCARPICSSVGLQRARRYPRSSPQTPSIDFDEPYCRFASG
jgi:hypothetical protein